MLCLRLLLAIMVLVFAASAARANTITDCKEVDDKATASVATGLTTQLSTSGKTCTFTVEGASTTTSNAAVEGNFRVSLTSFARVVVLSPGQVPSSSDLSALLFAPFFSDNVPEEFVDAVESAIATTFANCLRNGIFDAQEFSVDNFSSVPAGCGVVNPTGAPVDVSLPSFPNSVFVTAGDAVFVLCIEVSGTAFYAIFPRERLRFESGR